MVQLLNITFDGKNISCDYIPENSNKIGKVTVDAVTREVTNIEYSEYKFSKKMYVAHVRAKLSELLDIGQPIPNEAFAIWY
ncbi:hypothetical protein [Huintestinicola sp.]|uniref:hypothetical protein n=1 Tax=Huintestinicola sp. TaxID=2981661 RepID=UPI003D7E4AEA